MKDKSGGPAFPGEQSAFMVPEGTDISHIKVKMNGMSLRQYYAAKAMQSLVAQTIGNYGVDRIAELNNTTPEEFTSRVAFSIADAMLAFEENEKSNR